MDFQINCLIRYTEFGDEPEKEYRLCGICPGMQKLIVINTKDTNAWLEELDREKLVNDHAMGLCSVVAQDPWLVRAAMLAEHASKASRDVRNANWDIVQTIVKRPDYLKELLDLDTRVKLIKGAMELANCSETKVRKALRRYLQRGMTQNALFGDYDKSGGLGTPREPLMEKRGRPGELPGRNLCHEDKKKCAKAIEDLYLKGICKSLRETYDRLIEMSYPGGEEIVGRVTRPILPTDSTAKPSFEQFRAWFYRGYENWKVKQQLAGERKKNLKYRGIPDGAVDPDIGPGSVYVIDSTPLDLYVCDAVTGQILGRPTLYLLVDLFSLMIVGFDISFESAGWGAVMTALDIAFGDKVEFCRELGLIITHDQWPCVGKPLSLLADRGEMLHDAPSDFAEAEAIDIANTPPYRADYKGHVERAFKRIKDELISHLPGAVNKNKERGDKDHRLDASLTIQETRRIIARFILTYNATQILEKYPFTEDMLQDRVQLRPMDLWVWGIANRGQPRVWNREVGRVNLLKRAQATVTAEGILFNGLYYTCDFAKENNWFSKARCEGSWKESVSWHPHNSAILYLRPNQTHGIEACRYTKRTPSAFHGKSWDEIKLYRKMNKDNQRKAKHEAAQQKANDRADTQAEVEVSKQRTASLRKGQTKSEQLQDIKPAQSEHRDRERATRSARFSPTPSNESQQLSKVAAQPDAPKPVSQWVNAPTKSKRLSKYDID